MQVEKMRKALETLKQTVVNRGGEKLHEDFDAVMEAWQELAEALPAIRTTESFMQSLVPLVSQQIDYYKLADILDSKKVADHISTSDISSEIDLRCLVEEIAMSDLVKHLDQRLIADKVFDQIKDDAEAMDEIVTTVRRAIQNRLSQALQG